MKKNYDYVIFSPYFGELPLYFNLWLNSCSYNKEIKFIVFTDDSREFDNVPENVDIIKISFENIREMVQDKFNFTIALDSPYKLCDYRPAYGYIFEEYLSNCKFWGYCDLDLIFGDIMKFMPKDIEQYDKISMLGHLCFIKNTPQLLKCFELKSNSSIDYKDIFSSNFHFAFDEIGDYGINSIFINNNLPIFDYQKSIADVVCTKPGMVLSFFENNKFYFNNQPRILSFQNGKILSYTLNKNKIEVKEYSYAHFQKRTMKFLANEFDVNNFFILPNGFDKYDDQNLKEIIVKNSKGKFKWFFKRIKIRSKALIKKVKRKNEIRNINKKNL